VRVVVAFVALAVVLIVVGVTTLVVVNHANDEPGPGLRQVTEQNSANVGQPAPDFQLETIDGGSVRLSDFRGRPVVLNFWASWCTPCREEFPLFRSTLARADGQFAMVGVDTGDLRGDAREFARQQHATWPNGFDNGNTVARGYGVDPLPQTFFIDADGTIKAHVIRGVTRTELERELRTIGVDL
jgi:cytochrome c biogenesis protein CcmG/thiol:disulfide interchange protein DsbE